MDDTADTALPPGLDLLWGLRERNRRGPRPGLSLERIVQAAIELADAEGLAAVSMSRVAERLGFTTMSLYRYVASKDELLTLMMDSVAGELSVPDDLPPGWRAGLTYWAKEQLALFRRHPWTAQIPITGPPLGPRALAWMEVGLRMLEDTGLAGDEKLGVISLLSGYVRGEAQLSMDLAAALQAHPRQATYGELLRTVLDADRYPILHGIAASGALDFPSEYSEADFDFGLQLVLDGIGVLIASRSRDADGADRQDGPGPPSDGP